ncbi:DUF1624 domain-containing protein [Leptobacterium flavescens]|uniref:DUF1624 domain-containing protein n=1 Tax=Leptobacterium flavescens TaxID=472055 RepID=A0A6P0UU37_9FLAO|nr:heparan-alpha-glucosaminide N-acetyltransferase domain-containing protein [Leptobacterium flavescens]NER13936.1 DUF1624 domain-containing protein [Leptobacterium flavescens]
MKEQKKVRLYFIDAMRAWAILMMLQGHFIDGLLHPAFRDENNIIYTTWRFFRGITAPTFFTVSGFIFTYLLIREGSSLANGNPRIKKGIKRGLMLIGIGYLLRLNIFGLFDGVIYNSFYLVDVLHCIGLSILFLIGIYAYSANKKKYVLPTILGIVSVFIFLLEPAYKALDYSFLPGFIANYFSKANGSVFTIFPWFGYASIGGFIAVLFQRYKQVSYLYPKAIVLTLLSGLLLTFYSSRFFLFMFEMTQIQIFADVFNNNYLFIRFGNVLILFAVFMFFRSLITSKIILDIGKSTLYIYVIHFIILYGSFTGLGLYKYFHHSVDAVYTITGAALFLIVVTYLSLLYGRNKVQIKMVLANIGSEATVRIGNGYEYSKPYLSRIKNKLLKSLGLSKN